MELTQVLIKPLISEKSTALLNKANAKCVTFLVHPDANKTEIRRAVETIFGVTVLKVNVACGKARDYVRQSRRHAPFGRLFHVSVACAARCGVSSCDRVK